jgi:hypothetical protein
MEIQKQITMMDKILYIISMTPICIMALLIVFFSGTIIYLKIEDKIKNK